MSKHGEHKKVVFRHIGGRIVPIRLKEGLEGAGQVAAGAGVGLGGAYLAGRGLKKVVDYSNKAKASVITSALSFDPTHSTSLGKKVYELSTRSAARNLKKVGKIAKISKRTLFGSRLVGAALVGAGVEKLVRSTTNAQSEDRVMRFGAHLSGFLATAGTYTAFISGYDKKLVGKLVKVAKVVK